jgi:orotate phosphoribosyltransferase
MNILETLNQVGALITDTHVVYTSGRHGNSYVNKDALYPHTAATSAVCGVIAEQFAEEGIEVVAGPTVGGVIMAQWVAHHLSQRSGREVLAIYAEEEISAGEKRRLFRRGYDELLVGKRILIVEDILTTGGSARQVVEAVARQGGETVGVAALCNRGGVTAEQLQAPTLFCLTSIPLESFDPATCPLCAAGIPINTRVGKGKRA